MELDWSKLRIITKDIITQPAFDQSCLIIAKDFARLSWHVSIHSFSQDGMGLLGVELGTDTWVALSRSYDDICADSITCMHSLQSSPKRVILTRQWVAIHQRAHQAP